MPLSAKKATGTLGARRTARRRPTQPPPPRASIRKTNRSRGAASLVATTAPEDQPAEDEDLNRGDEKGALVASRWKVCSYWSEASEVNPAMAAARKGSAMKIRRSTPIFHTRRQASPNDGGGSASPGRPGRRQRARQGRFGLAEHRSRRFGDVTVDQGGLFLSTAPRLAEAETDQHHDGDGNGEGDEGDAPAEGIGQPRPDEHAGHRAERETGPVGGVDAGP